MAKTRSNKNLLRTQLVDHCRSLRGFLKLTLEPRMHIPTDKLHYYERWQVLDKVLADFEHNPGNLDSRFSEGLAEKIHKVEPTKTFHGTGRIFFILKPTDCKDEEFGPVELAEKLEEAYRRKGFGDSPIADFYVWGEDYGQHGPDLICSELNNFFNGLATLLRRHEDDKALALSRRESESREKFENEHIERSHKRDPNLKELFARKHCQFCFRLIPERSGETKSSTGKTCALHDPQKNMSRYLAARKRYIAQEKKLVRQRKEKAINVARNANDPELIPWKTNLLMRLNLDNLNEVKIIGDNLFSITKTLFSSKKNQPVDTPSLQRLLDEIQRSYPPISRPEKFVKMVQSLIDSSQHSPMNLIQLVGQFVFDKDIPFHPTIVAIYMCLFQEESWYAQNNAPDYYHSGKGKGRPIKVDKVEMLQVAQSLRRNDKMTKAQAIKQLAEEFDCSPTRVRQILRENEIS